MNFGDVLIRNNYRVSENANRNKTLRFGAQLSLQTSAHIKMLTSYEQVAGICCE